MKLQDVKQFVFGTLRGRLILGVALIQAVMMTLFIIDLTIRQRAILLDRHVEEATTLAQSLSTSAAVWIASEDVSGLQELVESEHLYPKLIFAIITDEHGRILAHTDPEKKGLYLLELPKLIHKMSLVNNPELVDVIVPAHLSGRHIGWVRIRISNKATAEQLTDITLKGVLYAIIAIFIGSFIAWFMGRQITRSLYAVQNTINEVRTGNTSVRSHIKGTDEAASIATEFNILLDSLVSQSIIQKQSEAQIIKLNRIYSVLSNINQAIVRFHDPVEMMKEACRIAVEYGKFEMAWIGMVNIGSDKVEVVASYGDTGDYLEKMNIDLSDAKRVYGPTGTAVLTGKHKVSNNILVDDFMTLWRNDALKCGYHSSASFPLIVNEKVIGTFNLYSDEAGFFQDDNNKLLDEMAKDISFALGFIENETEREQAEKAQIESEEKYKTLIQKIQVAVVVHSADTQIITCNPKAQELLGLTEDQLLGKTSIDPAWHFYEEDNTVMLFENYPVNRVINSQQELINYIVGVHRPNSENDVWVLANADPVFDKNNQIDQIIVTFTDITDRKFTEEALSKSEKEFRTLAENSPDVVIRYDRQGHRIYVNPEFERVNNLSAQEALGKSPIESSTALTPMVNVFMEKLLATMESGTITKEDLTWTYAGKLMCWYVRIVPEYDSNGIVVSALTIWNDITDRKLAESALAKTTERLNEAQRIAQIGSWELDVVNNVLSWSDEIFRMFEIDPEKFSATYEAFLNTIHPDDRADVNSAYANSLKTKMPYSIDHRLFYPDGRIKYVHEECETIFDENDNPVRSVGIVQDITEKKRIEEEILKLNLELEQRVSDRTARLESVNKELEAFSYSISHDLRAPLRGIAGFSQVLLEDYQDKLDDTGKNYIARIRAGTKKMDELIDSLLRLARISRFEMNFEEVNLSRIVAKIASDLKESDKARKATFIIHEDIKARCDADLLKIVFENLLSNAWKFTSKQDETIIEFGTIQEDSKTVYYIKDNGVGFDMKYVNKLFSAFQRLHSDKEYPGTGVGLTTVQRIIRRHNGEIWVRAEIENGATFYFTIA